jgi:multisubunit Na+/H+ antiporter MnhB subunit
MRKHPMSHILIDNQRHLIQHSAILGLHERQTMVNLLTWFIWGWIALVFIANLAAILGFLVGETTFWDGWAQVSKTYGPLNLVNLLVEVVVLSPAIAASYWRDRLRAKK